MFGFLKKKKQLKEISSSVNDIAFIPVYHNDAISIVHDACKICVAGTKKRNLEEKIKFISDKIKLGHESILEHSNFIVKLTMMPTNDNLNAFIEIQECLKYLNVATKIYNDRYDILIGGSARGFKHVIRTIKNYKNPIYITLLDYIKLDMPSCFFSDLIEENILKQIDFLDLFEDNDYKHYDYTDWDWNAIDAAVPCYMDPVIDIYNRMAKEFDLYTLMDFCYINTLFINVSRCCSHQLVRHRAGITQLSQRYVNMKDYPMVFSLEIDEELEPVKSTLSAIMNTYNELIDEGTKREDARYILPNACSTSLYMTFSIRGFLKAYSLRTGKGAQQEIHKLFSDLMEHISHIYYIPFLKELANMGYNFEDFVKPRYEFEALVAEIESKLNK